MRFLIICLWLICSTFSYAQKVIIDPLFSDSAKCIKTVKDNKRKKSIKKQEVFLIQGTEVEAIIPKEDGYYITLIHEGDTLYASPKVLKFSPNNPKNLSSPFGYKHDLVHSKLGHWYTTYDPAITISCILCFAFLVSLLSYKIKAMIKPTLVIIPLSIIAVAIIEILGLYLLGFDFFWWCDYQKSDFSNIFFKSIPISIILLMQHLLYKRFKALFILKATGKSYIMLSIKPIIIYSIAGFFIMSLYNWIMIDILQYKGQWLNLGTIGIPILSFTIGLIIVIRRNIIALGSRRGLFLTFFSIIYLFSFLIVVIVPAIAAFAIAFIVLIFFILIQALSHRTVYVDMWGNYYTKD